MKKIILLLSLLLTTQAFATSTSVKPGVLLPKDVEALLNNGSINAAGVLLGSQVTAKKLNVMKAVYDFAKLGGASGTSAILRDASGGIAVLPAKALIKRAVIDVQTPLAGTSASASIGIITSADIKASALATTYTGVVDTLYSGSVFGKVGATNVAPTISFIGIPAGSSVTAGKFNLFIEYYLSE